MEVFNSSNELPPLPEYSLTPLPPLISGIDDKLLQLLMPIVAYWVFSMFFHWIDMKDYFSQYRLHTPAEVLKRNHVSRYEVVRDVIIQQIIQTATGMLLNLTEPDEYIGKEQYDVAVWATRVRLAQKFIPGLLALASVNAQGLASNLQESYPMLSGAIAGGVYPTLTQVVLSDGVEKSVPMFATWELVLAKAVYYAVIPLLQFTVAILIVDTWQYFLHRAMHMNKWLYSMSNKKIVGTC
jgi:sphinganine C4-monooxygenase